MKIQIGEYDLYESGSLISGGGQPTEFFFPNFSVQVKFENTENKSEQAMIFNLEEEHKRLVISLKNFTNTLGIENVEPIEVGKINNRKLYLQFRVYGMDNSENKLFHYTWLLEKEDQNG